MTFCAPYSMTDTAGVRRWLSMCSLGGCVSGLSKSECEAAVAEALRNGPAAWVAWLAA